MSMSDSNKLVIQHNVSLKPHNTFGFDIHAAHYTAIHSTQQLFELLKNSAWQKTPKLMLGSASNILFTQDFNGLVIHNHIKGIETIGDDEDFVWLTVGAGENWHRFVLYCIDHELGGVENLSLIPGTVGAAPIQNIGAYGVELQNVLHTVHTISIENQQTHTFSHTDCELGYRDSIFKNKLKNKHIITHVTFQLSKKPMFQVEYGDLKKTLQLNEIKTLSLRAISDAVIQIRRQKLPDPQTIGNAGSFFKNPIITKTMFLTIQKQYPNIPFFTLLRDEIKIPAAWLIEQCGFKGKRFGEVGVHDQQALVLINYGLGVGKEIKTLSEHIQKTVFDRFGIILTSEVNIV